VDEEHRKEGQKENGWGREQNRLEGDAG